MRVEVASHGKGIAEGGFGRREGGVLMKTDGLAQMLRELQEVMAMKLNARDEGRGRGHAWTSDYHSDIRTYEDILDE